MFKLRYCGCILFSACLALLFSIPSWGQITDVTNDQSTPIPGAGHDYFHMLTETVNPANGSVSVRIQVPVPKGRGLTLPFAFAYDSNGVSHPGSSGNGVMAWYSNTSFLSQGGWSYSMPLMSMVERTMTYNHPPYNYTCNYYVDYVFADPSGGRHAAGLSAWDLGSVNQCDQIPSAPRNATLGGDDYYQAITPDPTTWQNGGPWLPVMTADTDGTVYHFPSAGFHGSPGIFVSLPDYVEDRNGNKIIITDNGNGAFTVTDTLGRTAVESSGFGTNGSAVTVSGLASAYTVNWGSTIQTSYPVGATKVGNDSYCNPFLNESGKITPISTITLPNGQAYTFIYDTTYGLLKEIEFPTGGWVQYTWAVNPQSEFGAFADTEGNSEACQYTYGMPAISERKISYDGTNVAEDQTFLYNTTWGNSVSWTQKTTQVTTTDKIRGKSFVTLYTYSPVSINLPPNEVSHFSPEVPVEQQIVYSDWSGNTLMTVTKTWQDQYLMTQERTTPAGGGTAEKDYKYSEFCEAFCTIQLLTNEKDYDYSSSPPGVLLKQTNLPSPSYWQPGLSPVFGFGSTFYRTILDRPLEVTISGTSGTAAQTTYAYDVGGITSANVTVGRDLAYNGNSGLARGNATTKTEACLQSCAAAKTTYTYDDTGQMLSVTDADNNLTSYSYADSYTSGTPPGPTNAYLTTIKRPALNSVNHIETFSYGYADGQLTVEKDESGQYTGKVTQYTYDNSLDRLTNTSYPDGGQTGYAYDDTPGSVSVTTTKVASPSPSVVTTSSMDGAGHPTRTELASDTAPKAGPDYTDTTYDGEGLVFTKSNPYRSTGDPSYGLTTYTYDALGRTTSVQYADSNTATTSYSANCSTAVDPAGKSSKSCTDGLGRLSEVIEDPGGLAYVTTYSHDALDNLTNVTQGTQTPRSFAYDSLSRLTSATNPESGTVNYTYDANGNVLTRKDANSVTTTYQYDALNRLTSKSYSDGTPAANFWYDNTSAKIGNWTVGDLGNPQGRLYETCTSNAVGTCPGGYTGTVYSYDPMGRVASEWQCTPYNCGSSAWQTTYSYDLAGDVASYIHPTTDPYVPANFTITYGIDGAQHVTGITSSWSDAYHPNPLISNISHSAWGALTVADDNCVGTGCAYVDENYYYNNRMQLTQVQVPDSALNSLAYCFLYNYYQDKSPFGGSTNCASGVGPAGAKDNGSVAGDFFLGAINPGLAYTGTYTYDSLNRLKVASATGTYAYSLTMGYDQYGNMTCTPNPGQCAQLSYINPITGVDNNQIQSSGYTYDKDGNLLTDGANTFTYDAEGRVTSVVNSTGTTQIVYYADGRQAEQVWPSTWTGEYTYDPWGVPEMWAFGCPGCAYAAEDYIPLDGRVVVGYRETAPEETQYYHYDGRGSVVMQMNQAGQYETEQLDYPWGQAWEGNATEGQGYGDFADMEEGGASGGIDLTPNRAYGSTQGRWLSPDPMGGDMTNPQSLNRYTYVLNNPMSLVDPMGMGPCTIQNYECGQNACNNLQYGQGKGQCQNGVNGVIAANTQLGPTGWDPFEFTGFWDCPNGDCSYYDDLPAAIFADTQQVGTTPAPNNTNCTTSARVVQGTLGAANLADAYMRATALPEAVAALAEAPPAAAVAAIYGVTSIFGQALSGGAQVFGAITGNNSGSVGGVQQVGNILAGPASGLGTLVATGGNLATAERNANIESLYNGGVGLVNKATPLVQRFAEGALGAAGVSNAGCHEHD